MHLSQQTSRSCCWHLFKHCSNTVQQTLNSYTLLTSYTCPKSTRIWSLAISTVAFWCMCRSSCALFGFSGTFIAKDMIAKSGLLRAGMVSTIFQGVVLTFAALIYHFKLAPVHVRLKTSTSLPMISSTYWSVCYKDPPKFIVLYIRLSLQKMAGNVYSTPSPLLFSADCTEKDETMFLAPRLDLLMWRSVWCRSTP